MRVVIMKKMELSPPKHSSEAYTANCLLSGSRHGGLPVFFKERRFMDDNDVFMSMANAQANKKKKAGYYTDVRADIKRKEKTA